MAEEEEPVEREDWTPFRGMIRGVAAGLVVAAVLGAAADWLAWQSPLMAINGWMRTGAGLLTMYVLFFTVHRTAGMAGPACTVLVVVLTLAIAVSQHVVFALHGVPTSKGLAVGWEWCSPEILLAANLWTFIGIVFGVLLWRDGANMASLVDILRLKMYR